MPKKLSLNLYSYFFHFNSYTQKWNVMTREDSKEYLNGSLPKGRVKSSRDINVLIEAIS